MKPSRVRGMLRALAISGTWLAVRAFAGAPAQPSLDSLLRGKYIDIHCHTAGIGAKGSGCFVCPALRQSYKFRIYLKAFGVTEAELLREGDALVLDRISRRLEESRRVGAAVILALDGVADSLGNLDSAKTQVYIPNAFVAAETRRHPNLLFGASINPLRRGATEELALAATQGAVLIKWIPSIMGIDPADRALIPFYLAMKQLGLPLLTHTGKESSFLGARNELCDPVRLELPLSLGLTVIAAHVGTPGKSLGEDNVDRLMRLFPRFPNLYADISSLTQANKLRYLACILPRPEARGRLVYGTDFPLIETLLVSPYYFSFSPKLSFRQVRALARVKNPWDRDVELKRALGVPEDAFLRTRELLFGPRPRSVTDAKNPN